MNPKPMMYFWIRANKATRKRIVFSIRHMWKICVAHLKPIQSHSIRFNPIELNYVYRYSCKSVQFAALHIPVAHTYRIYNILFSLESQRNDIYHRILIVFLLSIDFFLHSGKNACFNCYLALHLCMAKVPKMVGSKAFRAHDRNRRQR